MQAPVAPGNGSDQRVDVPEFRSDGTPSFQTNLIFPLPCEFISLNLPMCAVMHPTSPGQLDAVGVYRVVHYTDAFFIGQPQEFIDLLRKLTQLADAAPRKIFSFIRAAVLLEAVKEVPSKKEGDNSALAALAPQVKGDQAERGALPAKFVEQRELCRVTLLS